MTELYGSPDRVGYDDLQAIMDHSLGLRMQYKQEPETLKKDKIIPLYESLYPDCPPNHHLGSRKRKRSHLSCVHSGHQSLSYG